MNVMEFERSLSDDQPPNGLPPEYRNHGTVSCTRVHCSSVGRSASAECAPGIGRYPHAIVYLSHGPTRGRMSSRATLSSGCAT